MIFVHGILIVIIMSYFILMSILMIGWIFSLKKEVPEQSNFTDFSILIPFRNESNNISDLIRSLSKLEYDKNKIEFIFINDHSIDNGVDELSKQLVNFPFNFQILALEEGKEGKKEAIQKGVYHAQCSNIVTTDADCVHSTKWLLEINKLITQGSEFVISPVLTVHHPGIFSSFQEIESLMLAGVSLGSVYFKKPLLCSGANLAYSKTLFNKLKPYHDNLNTKSGDDMFFLEKVVKEKNISIVGGVSTNTIVQTSAPISFKEMFNRSIRWASKSAQLNILATSFFGAIVLIANYSILLMTVLFFFATDSIEIFIKLCSIKAFVDILFLILLAYRYKRLKVIIYLPIMVIYYPIYLVLVSVGVLFITPVWKGR